jgi:WD40 repeat protein
MPGNPIARRWKFDTPIVSMSVSRDGGHLAIALGDGQIALGEASDLTENFTFTAAHLGVSLSMAPDSDAHAFLSGGDDGVIAIIDPNVGDPVPVATHKGKWIDHVAASKDGVRAFACGKQVFLLNDEAQPLGEPMSFPSSVGGLAFSPNGKRLAISHYNGISLLWVNAKDRETTFLPWKGSHLDLIWTPDSKMVLSSMQEGALHGWDLSNPSDIKEMQMQGYTTKIHSMGFTSGGKFLATSGADQIICWPFTGGGPWGKPPLTLGGSETRLVTTVAPHPRDPVVAAGYDDGMLILAPLDGRMEIMLYPPDSTEGSKFVSTVWSGDGSGLFAAQENGSLLLYTLASLRRYATGQ